MFNRTTKEVVAAMVDAERQRRETILCEALRIATETGAAQEVRFEEPWGPTTVYYIPPPGKA